MVIGVGLDAFLEALGEDDDCDEESALAEFLPDVNPTHPIPGNVDASHTRAYYTDGLMACTRSELLTVCVNLLGEAHDE